MALGTHHHLAHHRCGCGLACRPDHDGAAASASSVTSSSASSAPSLPVGCCPASACIGGGSGPIIHAAIGAIIVLVVVRLVKRAKRSTRRALADRAAAPSFPLSASAVSRPHLAGAAHHVLEGGELLDADRAARMQPAGGDADLRAHAELAAVGELRRGIVQHDRAVEAARKRSAVSWSSATMQSVCCEP